MTSVLLTKAGATGKQKRVPSHQVVKYLMQGYHLVRHSAIITRVDHRIHSL